MVLVDAVYSGVASRLLFFSFIQSEALVLILLGCMKMTCHSVINSTCPRKPALAACSLQITEFAGGQAVSSELGSAFTTLILRASTFPNRYMSAGPGLDLFSTGRGQFVLDDLEHFGLGCR